MNPTEEQIVQIEEALAETSKRLSSVIDPIPVGSKLWERLLDLEQRVDGLLSQVNRRNPKLFK